MHTKQWWYFMEVNNIWSVVFQFFIRKFHKMLNAPDVSSKTFSLAIRGYGLFAGSCKRYMESGNIQKMFMEIMNRCEDIYFKYKSHFLSDLKINCVQVSVI